MAKQSINIGSTANDGSGDPLRTAFQKINANFSEIYAEFGGDNLSSLYFDGNNIKATLSNDDIRLIPHGTGRVNIPSSLDVLDTAYLYNISSTGLATLTNVTVGNTTQLNTLRLNSGVTVSEFSTDNTMGGVGTSDAKLPTQKAVKKYVENLLADTYIIEVETDSGIIDLYDNDIFLVTGGTGIRTVGDNGAKRLTLNIDNNVVVTLTDSQILTNKNLTSPVISSISNSGTITIPTGTDTLVARNTTDTLTNKTLTAPVINNATSISTNSLSVTNAATVGGTLNTKDIITTGDVNISGGVTSATLSAATSIASPVLKTNEIISDDSTAIQINDGLNINGDVNVPVGFNTTMGNITVYSNNITAPANSDINVVASGSGKISLQSSITSAYQVNAVSVRLSDHIDTNRVRSYASNADITIEPQGTGTVDFALPTVTAGVGSGQADISSVATYLKIKINGTEYAIPAYAINP